MCNNNKTQLSIINIICCFFKIHTIHTIQGMHENKEIWTTLDKYSYIQVLYHNPKMEYQLFKEGKSYVCL